MKRLQLALLSGFQIILLLGCQLASAQDTNLDEAEALQNENYSYINSNTAKLNQCNKIIRIANRVVQEVKAITQDGNTSNHNVVIQAVEVIEKALEEMENIEIDDEQLKNFQTGFIRMYRDTSQATREFVDASNRENLPAIEAASRNLRQATLPEKELVNGINHYCINSETERISTQEAKIKYLQVELISEIDAQQTRISQLETQLQEAQTVQEATLRRLEAELRTVEKDFRRFEQLVQEGVIPQSELNSRRLQIETAREQLKEAEVNRQIVIETLREELKEAREQLKEEGANLQIMIETLREQLKEAREQLKEAEANLQIIIETYQEELQRLKNSSRSPLFLRKTRERE
ncbi:MAG: hypothetical protein F6K41_41810 [Symploca sp. SIO3E6]|nr:hypothetical protein [Caldora sp. SIO3E6]